jgi:RimJ/RimL family protein N-acetyltransferase
MMYGVADCGVPDDLLIRPRTLADLPDLWRWLHGTPGAEWKRWDGPYFEKPTLAVTFSDYTAQVLARGDEPDLNVIEIAEAVRGIVTRHWEAPEAGGWLELGIVIFEPAFWSGGSGTQALRLWTAQSFKQTHAHVITLTTWSGNERMIRAAERVGYRECARVPEARLWQGARYDSVRLGLLRSGWPESESNQLSAKLPS